MAMELGARELLPSLRDAFEKQPVDLDMTASSEPAYSPWETTLVKPVSVTGPGTFLGREQRKLILEPSLEPGWRFDRTDLPDCMPIDVSVKTVWTGVWASVRNIVLSSGSPHNYMRLVEHMIALKVGLGLDNLTIRLDSGDPPLFDRGSLDLVEAIEQAGLIPTKTKAAYVTVKEPVTLCGKDGSYVTFLPAAAGRRQLDLDCAIDFKSAIGKQRIRFTVSPETFRQGAEARTNTTVPGMVYSKTIGKLFADIRNLGYTTKNVIVAGREKYFNQPRLLHNGKSLESAWHRAVLDLLAAVALIDRGRFAGQILSYKAGHALDVQMIRELYRRDLLEMMP